MKIEYPKLQRIGGLKNYLHNTVLRVLIVILMAAVVGYGGGYTAQKSFRNITGYNQPRATVVEEVKEATEIPDYEGDNAYMGALTRILQVADTGIIKTTNLLKESEPVQMANAFSLSLIYGALNPILKIMDWVAFWFSFALCFSVTTWATSRLINLKVRIASGGVDPAIIKNLEILEAKVNELVDHANHQGGLTTQSSETIS